MSSNIRIGIVGYGNLGRGVHKAIGQNKDLELVAIFTRRDVNEAKGETDARFEPLSALERFKGEIDVMILCGGSATDLPEQTPMVAAMFNTVDSFDTHAKIPAFYQTVDEAARKAGTVSVISTGWDPGLFSMNRLLAEAILPQGKEYTFWGRGVSQGHSDAIRRVPGVRAGVQYTIPVEEAIASVRSGVNPNLTTRDKHERLCYVVPEHGADTSAIEREIKNMPNYFAEYDTTVVFITEEQLRTEHAGMPHGGFVLRSGTTGDGTNQLIEFGLKLGSNPEFTASVLVAYARAAARLSRQGAAGAKTVFDIPLGYLSPYDAASLRERLL
ncbi:diaminopimelate dehydrogenase [Cohnella sp. JJ-181]|uniref:diaminopimelate dehydrogenase n=1 Tax=Cohnella rhizoplanae TaxID=2974897 RepID=UPI0022FF995C|nr:diaminopimelate dehydrogenase [Cohnella sp. JJ-181]CAI6032933.1 Meso-diaminopimelate D-dehydrogenase [Cohnella sp. JJ-181]